MNREWTRDQEKALRLGLSFDPRRPELLYDLAGLLAFRRHPDDGVLAEAVKLAKQAAEMQPGMPEYWRILALAHLHAKDLARPPRRSNNR